jgi:YggT family protein
MIIAGYFLKAVAELLHAVLIFFIYIMIARAILSWVNPDPNNGIVRFLHGATDPLLERVRRFIPPLGMFDMSVLVIILGLYFIDSFLVGVLHTYGQMMLKANPAPL